MSSVPRTGNKGSDVFSSTGDPRLDLRVLAVRGATPEALAKAMTAVLAMGTQQSFQDAYVLALHNRNIRGGQGERDVFYNLFTELYAKMPKTSSVVLDLIPQYGSWLDLLHLTQRSPILNQATAVLFAKQLEKDASTLESDPISLVGKWAPREDAKTFKATGLAKSIAYMLFPHVDDHSSKMRRYRQLVADLNKRLNTVETLMCSDRWDSIRPSTVPGRAGKVYSRAFLNLPSTFRGEDRAETAIYRREGSEQRMACRQTFLEHYAAAAQGKAKVTGADTLFPHEIVKKAATVHDPLSEPEKDHLRGVWRSMVAKAKASGGLGRSIFMSDFSGSMQSSSAGDTPYWVSMALGMLGAECCSEEFKDRLLSFDSTPRWHHFATGSDLFDRVHSIQSSRIGQGLSTDFQKAMDLVLQTLKDKRVHPGQEPENLIVLTDMNWDQACSSSETSAYTQNRYRHVVKTTAWETHVEMIKEAFKRAGEDMWGTGHGFVPPRIVIWNLAASPQTDYHATASTPGVVMLSGWSPSQFEILMKEGPRQMTAYEMLRLELDDPKYQPIRDRLRAIRGDAAAF